MRSDWLVWHRRVALLFAPLILLQALTGSVLLFREPLGELLDEAPSTGALQPTDRLYAAAATTGQRVERLFLPQGTRRTALAQVVAADGTRGFAMIDAGTAQVVREGGFAAFPVEGALQLHYRLLDGTLGLFIVTLNGIVLLLMATSGLAYWWPAKGRWGKSLAINPRLSGRLRLRHWHRSAGVVAAVLIGASGVTGTLLAGTDLLPALTSAPVAPTAAAEPAPESAPESALGADAVAAGLQLAQAEFPGAALRDLRLKPGQRMEVNLLAPEHNSMGVHVVKVDLAARKVIAVIPAQDNPALWMKVLPFHAGTEFGLAGRLVLLLEALVLVGLAVSGPWMWWQQRKRHP